MQTSLRGIARKAKQNRNYKFGNLYGLLNKEALYQAWKDINKKSAVGIDKESASEFGNNLDEKLEELVKWLKAGILDIDGKVINPLTGCPHGSTVSPILANSYLHYALDLWFEKIVKPACNGEAYLCRLADDFICAFNKNKDAERFYKVLGKRLGKFKLELAEEKTNILPFSRFKKYERKSFEFLGFEFRWGVSLKGKDTFDSNYDAIFITKINLSEASQGKYASIYKKSKIPFFFIQTEKSYVPFTEKDLTYDNAPNFNDQSYATGILYNANENGNELTSWGYGLYNDIENQANIEDVYSRIFDTISQHILPK